MMARLFRVRAFVPVHVPRPPGIDRSHGQLAHIPALRVALYQEKQERMKRPRTIDSLPVDEFLHRNADPVWLLQNEMYAALYPWEQENLLRHPGEGKPADVPQEPEYDSRKIGPPLHDDDVPF